MRRDYAQAINSRVEIKAKTIIIEKNHGDIKKIGLKNDHEEYHSNFSETPKFKESASIPQVIELL